MKNWGIDINCSYPVTDICSYNIGLIYASNHISKIKPQVSVWRYLYSININPSKLSINNRYLNNDLNFYISDIYIFLILGWSFNDLDVMYFPKFGSHVDITSKVTLPGSNNAYYKITVDSNHYLPLDKSINWIFTSKMFAGYAGGLYKNKENPFYDNFYIGGIDTIRGFRLNSIGPKAAYYCCSNFNKSYSECSIENSQDTIGH